MGGSYAQLLARKQSCVHDDAQLFWGGAATMGMGIMKMQEEKKHLCLLMEYSIYLYIPLHVFMYCYVLLCCNPGRSLDLQVTSKRLGGDEGGALLMATFYTHSKVP